MAAIVATTRLIGFRPHPSDKTCQNKKRKMLQMLLTDFPLTVNPPCSSRDCPVRRAAGARCGSALHHSSAAIFETLAISPGWPLCLARNHLSPLLFSEGRATEACVSAYEALGGGAYCTYAGVMLTFGSSFQRYCSDHSFLVDYFLHALSHRVWSPSASSWMFHSAHLTPSVTVTHDDKHAVSSGSKYH